jgi:N-acyl-D-amino-acid deacylase
MAMSTMSGEHARHFSIRNGLIVDGKGGDPYSGDVLIRGGQIAGAEAGSRSDVTVDATGLVVSPGFVDVHTHADLLAFSSPENEALRRGALLQGVTTVIAGNCGFSVFPVPSNGRGEDVARHLAALFGQGVRTFADLNSYAAHALSAGLDSNLATLVGQGTLRAAVVGFDRRPATDSEIEQMRVLAREALDQGALGISTGLLYPPGSFADTDEIVEIVTEAAGRDRLYVTHLRNEMDEVAEALREAIEVGQEVPIRVQISHLKSAGSRNHGRVGELLRIIENATEAGLEISADAYPYERGSTVLHALLPPWATEGGMEATLERLKAPEVRERIRGDIESPVPGWQNFIEGGSWNDVSIASAPLNHELEGQTITEAAFTRGQDPVDFVADLLVSENGLVTITVAMADEDDVTSCLSSPRVMIGSDGIPIPGRPHPRWAGSFARVLSRAGRDRFSMSISEAVHKMSGLPAGRFALGGLGTIEPGNTADLVVFDEEEIRDTATYADPLRPASGIHHVFLNGYHVVRDGVDTGLRAGRVVRAGGA